MQYFVYQLNEDKSLEYLDAFEEYAKAKELCRQHREKLKPGEPVSVRMVYAENKKEAKTLLTTPRKLSTPLEEWEG